MKRAFFIAAIVFTALALAGSPRLRAQSQTESAEPTNPAPIDQEAHHHLMYATNDIQVYDVVIPAGQSAAMYPNPTEYLLIGISNGSVTVDSPGQSPSQLDLAPGAVRMINGGSAYTLTNNANAPYHALSIQFLNSALLGRGCTCNDGAAGAICNCPNASALPANWSMRIGQLSLRGMTLAPGATYDNDSTDPARFIIAVTPFDMIDNTVHEPRHLEVHLPAGRFHWLGPGPHEIQNLSPNPMRFVCVEF